MSNIDYGEFYVPSEIGNNDIVIDKKEYDSVVAEIERLKQDLEYAKRDIKCLKEQNEELYQENEQIRRESQWHQIADDAVTELIQLKTKYIPELKQENEQLRHDYSQLILELVHTNEQLIVAKTKLQQEYEEQVQILLDDKKQLNWEIEQLRQALKECNNLCVCCYSCSKVDGHTDDCEYCRLMGGEG